VPIGVRDSAKRRSGPLGVNMLNNHFFVGAGPERSLVMVDERVGRIIYGMQWHVAANLMTWEEIWSTFLIKPGSIGLFFPLKRRKCTGNASDFMKIVEDLEALGKQKIRLPEGAVEFMLRRGVANRRRFAELRTFRLGMGLDLPAVVAPGQIGGVRTKEFVFSI
jgi:hypothetical protein